MWTSEQHNLTKLSVMTELFYFSVKKGILNEDRSSHLNIPQHKCQKSDSLFNHPVNYLRNMCTVCSDIVPNTKYKARDR